MPGAIWSFAEIDADRATEHPDLTKVCVAVDPPGGATECGIVVAGRARVDGTDHYYVLEDASGQLSPNAWGLRVIDRYHTHQASKVIAESNYGGDMARASSNTTTRTFPSNSCALPAAKRCVPPRCTICTNNTASTTLATFPSWSTR